jgi:hypothetical protein
MLDVIQVALVGSFGMVLLLAATRGRSLGYIVIQRDELGRWHWRHEKGE